MFKKIFNPMMFQGSRIRRKYFEGWYYKMVSADKKHTIAFIPGISLNPQEKHAFIQVFHVTSKSAEPTMTTEYFRYPLDAFEYDFNQNSFQVSKCMFSTKEIQISLYSSKVSVLGKIEINQISPLRKSLFSPSIMGPFAYIQFMECYHGIVSMSHQLKGTLNVNGQDIVFNGGKGYIEKDWGKSFPSSYVWMQSNHFENDSCSFMFSYATIPFAGLQFKGLIANLTLNGKEYRFATYNGAKIIYAYSTKNSVEYKIKKGKYILNVEAKSDTSVSLPSPKDGMMIQTIKEGLSGVISIELNHKGTKILSDTGTNAGLEIMLET